MDAEILSPLAGIAVFAVIMVIAAIAGSRGVKKAGEANAEFAKVQGYTTTPNASTVSLGEFTEKRGSRELKFVMGGSNNFSRARSYRPVFTTISNTELVPEIIYPKSAPGRLASKVKQFMAADPDARFFELNGAEICVATGDRVPWQAWIVTKLGVIPSTNRRISFTFWPKQPDLLGGTLYPFDINQREELLKHGFDLIDKLADIAESEK